MFETGYYNSRYFNKVLKDDDIVIKSSDNIEKIKSEYDYFYFLPNNLKRFFVQPFDLEIKNGIASYKMELIDYPNFAELCNNKIITDELFSSLLYKIDKFKKNYKVLNKEKLIDQANYLVIEKTKNRISDYKEYTDLLNRINFAFNSTIVNRKTWNKVISHGDLCFSNIIWVDSINLIKFIDPRGAKTKNDIYLDEYYDLAKLSHSIFGKYENIIYNNDTDYSNIYTSFLNYLKDKDIDIQLLYVYEASLFLSMIPLHFNNKHNIDNFIISCDNALKRAGY